MGADRMAKRLNRKEKDVVKSNPYKELYDAAKKRFTSVYKGNSEVFDDVFKDIAAFMLGYKDDSGRPVGSYIFSGPSGSGKTHFVRSLAYALHGKMSSFLYIDCVEYQHSHEIAKLTGSPAGYLGHKETKAMLCRSNIEESAENTLMSNPVKIILFDELPRASDSLHQLLFGVLDNGILTLGDTKKVKFEDCLIFFTSNEGDFGKNKSPGFGEQAKNRVSTRKDLGKIFPAAFTNRIDRIYTFEEYSMEEKVAVVKLQAQQYVNSIKTDKLIKISPEYADIIIKNCYSNDFGLRDVVRIAKDIIKNAVLDNDFTDQLDEVNITEEKILKYVNKINGKSVAASTV